MKKFVVLTAVLLSATVVVFAAAQDKEQNKDPGKEKGGGKRLTLSIEGVECAGCARVLSATLGECGFKVAGSLTPNKDGPVQVVATSKEGSDLAACATKVKDAQTPHRAQSPPSLSVVVFSKLDEKTSQEALTACRKIKGVDGAACKADAKTGQIQLKIAGDQKVTTEEITKALSDAGIQAQLTKSTSTR